MKVAIYSLQDILFEGEAEKLIVSTPAGQMTVLDQHIALISSLTGPSLEVVDKKGEKNIIKLVSGFLEVRPESEVVILANTR